MASLGQMLLSFRNDPRVHRLPPFLSLVCVLVGIAWLLVLPLDEYSRKTYISENALLPGQVHTYFGGSEHTVFRAYRHEVAALAHEPSARVAEKLEELFQDQGLKTGRQTYNYTAAGSVFAGENTYAILQGPRADATEAMVLIAAWRNMNGALNQSGVGLLLTLARYFKRWSLWSKDIIFVVTEDSTAGPQAWVDAYHDHHDRSAVANLPIKSGSLQGAIAFDYPAGTGGWRFGKLLVHYDGVNGQQPNLDLINTVVHIASGHTGVGCAIQQMKDNNPSYMSRLEALSRGMLTQGLGHATGPHASFMPYHVDALTLQTIDDGWHDEMALGRVIEGSVRSVNNLLEHLHQSFFFYLLMEPERFVSIGTYLPAAMLVAVNFSIMSISLWVRSGKSTESVEGTPRTGEVKTSKQSNGNTKKGESEVPLQSTTPVEERELIVPVLLIAGTHLLGLLPMYICNTTPKEAISFSFLLIAISTLILPYFAGGLLKSLNSKDLTLISCFSLLLLGIGLSTISTLNFSLGLIVGLLATPLSFVRAIKPRKCLVFAYSVVLNLFAPTTLLFVGSAIWKGKLGGINDLLTAATFAWRVNGTWTAVIVWLLWWPAWVVQSTVLATSLMNNVEPS